MAKSVRMLPQVRLTVVWHCATCKLDVVETRKDEPPWSNRPCPKCRMNMNVAHVDVPAVKG